MVPSIRILRITKPISSLLDYKDLRREALETASEVQTIYSMLDETKFYLELSLRSGGSKKELFELLEEVKLERSFPLFHLFSPPSAKFPIFPTLYGMTQLLSD